MALEIGTILEGKVTGLTKFGAFVDLGDGQTGMVHISEVASTYVNEITDFVEPGQEVKVKVLSIDETGKISLSIKQAEEGYEDKPRDKKPHKDFENKKRERPAPNVWQGQKPKVESDNMTFEEMMSKWKTSSDEKMADLKRSTDTKHSGYGKRSGARR